MVHPDVPAKTLKELGAYGRANPDKLTAGSSSATGTIAPTLLAAAEKFKMPVILYKSETHGAERPHWRPDPGDAHHRRAGAARARWPRQGLATLLPARSKALPDLPTHAESGIAPFPGIPWMGLFGPGKLPKEIVDRLSKELLAALAKPEVRTQIERAAMDINPLSPEGMAHWPGTRSPSGANCSRMRG